MIKKYQCAQCKGKDFYITMISMEKIAAHCKRCKAPVEVQIELPEERHKRCVEVGMSTSGRRDSPARTAQKIGSQEHDLRDASR